MEYQAFALKYRPKNFDEVIGQDHIVIPLKKAVREQRIHHAYLFSGPRGVGKTSVARILAKSLNCFQGPTLSPCEECLSCREIVKGTSLDVIEIDGASNRGIEEIRTLRESVKLSPSYSRYKIYIIDEVHMLTQEAFNALLKTLEEPPPHVKFIFATTHPHKVLPTILSRCQKFQFHLLSVEKIVEKLERIIERENMKMDSQLLYAIARTAEGSMRDAESLLDQLAPVLLEKKREIVSDIASFLGIVEEGSLNEITKLIIERNIAGILEFINKMSKEGRDLGVFINNLLEHLRNLILVKLSPKIFKEISSVSPHTKEFLSQRAELITLEDILKIMELLIEAKGVSRKLNTLRIPLELAFIKFCYKEKELNKMPFPSPSQAFSYSEEFSKEEDWENILEEETTEEVSLKESENLVELLDSDLKEIESRWLDFISQISKRKVSLASYLSEAKLSLTRDGKLVLGFSKKFSFHKEILEREKNKRFIEEALKKYFKKNLRISFALLEEPFLPQEKSDCDSKEEGRLIDDLLDTFRGTIDTDNE
ncbi:MAG: DNA polymerase III subunit gamma/tau [Candidatus Omnitrophica bacterium]|nr:DNA polymerase III subunit gamma/tau [Candidatus Omnitrophota bacterium]